MFKKEYEQAEYGRKIDILIKELEGKLLEREEIIRVVFLTIFAKQHVFLIGPPGVAKSMLLKTISRPFKDGTYWEILMTKETQEYQLVGVENSNDPFSRVLSMLDSDFILNTLSNTGSRLREILSLFNFRAIFKKRDEEKKAREEESILYHHFLMFDEMFKGPQTLLNATLPMLNERVFYSKGKEIHVPLMSLFAASNEIPSGELIAPFKDRLLAFLEVLPIQDGENMRKFINGQFDRTKETSVYFSIDEIEYCVAMARKHVYFPMEVENMFIALKKAISKDGIEASDRKFGPDYIVLALKVSAWLNNRDFVNYSDLLHVRHFAWSSYLDRDKLWRVVHNVVFGSESWVSGQIEAIKKENHSIMSFFNSNIASFLDYSLDFFGQTGRREFENKIEELLAYFEKTEELLFAIKEVWSAYEHVLNVLDECKKNRFIYKLEQRTFSMENVKTMESFIQQKENQISEIKNWYAKNKTMGDYQGNQSAMKKGVCAVEYSFA